MKTPSFFRTAIMLIAVLTAVLLRNNANARLLIAVHHTSLVHSVIDEDSNTQYVPFTGTKKMRLNNISIHAMRDFMIKYKDVDDASWYEVDNGFVARFTAGEATTTVTYKKNGEWLYTITSYGEMKMPENIRALVKGTYYDYSIVNIEEVQIPYKENNIFLVKMQDATTIKVVRIYEGEMEVIHDYTKG
ncbi:hypothetical protein FC093_15855 [Ilyomonas limi]|uniref:Uncharacterized protein n=1 Tax=Ilyomonas limi TaxID=2575867 RepID=A0A4V5UTY2_9BACT|nr:hypothetical protein [Ilyomonas limi]TKK66973.1 hypothetical protein FC093_15855 [Ilyomonas limi]